MPPLVRRYIKTSFVFFALGMFLGGAMIAAQEVFGIRVAHRLVVAHAHVLLVGFVLMLVMGVATWMFPRPARDDIRYRPGVAEAIYWIVTVATLLRFGAELLGALWPGPGLGALVAVGGLGQVLGGLLFVVNIWVRVRAPATLR